MTTTHDDELAKAFLAWIEEGRDAEQVHGVTNFLSSKHFNEYIKARELVAQIDLIDMALDEVKHHDNPTTWELEGRLSTLKSQQQENEG